MINFVTKKTLEIDKNILCFNEGKALYKKIQNLFRENDCEIILIYEGIRYCGYIESSNIFDIVMPEYYLGYDPIELAASDNLMEELKEKFQTVQKKILIPVKGPEADMMRVFASDRYEDSNFVKYLEKYAELDNPYFLLEEYSDKKIAMLPELDEFTYICYKLLKQKKQRCNVEGQYWKYINVYNEVNYDIKKSEVLEYNYTDIINLLERMVKIKVSEEFDNLCKIGIKVFKVIIPDYEELAVHGELEEKMKHEIGISIESLRKKDSPNRQFWINHFMKTECSESEEELLYSSHPGQYGKEEKTIYLAGPCIVAGVSTTETSSIAYLLYQKLIGEDIKYSVKRISRQKYDISLVEELRAIDLRENDIIIYITDSHAYRKENGDLDLLKDYNDRTPDDCWFIDYPIHTLRRGNEMIVNRLYPLIKEAYECETTRNRYIRIGKPSLSVEQKFELQKYIDSVRFQKRDKLCVGCIVMNANPFTKGHLYLVEQAAEKVDELLVFVVEEDLSEFSFYDRLQMVKCGVNHMHNVRVIPSGRFILSRHTFVSYFEKDKRQDEKVDSALDIRFFGAYIVPAFGISKRFVGEEPKDLVTRQYNEEMKARLPMYGVEVVEIPRKEVKEGVFISATTVRNLYRIKDWESLADYLPDNTMEYLSRYNIIMRDKEKLQKKTAVSDCVTNSLEKILSKYNKVVLYSMGTDGKGLYRLVKECDRGKIILCDKRADTEVLTVEGKPVYAPLTLIKEFSDLPIVISSTQFRKDIYTELVGMGICQSRIIQNIYSFWQVSN